MEDADKSRGHMATRANQLIQMATEAGREIFGSDFELTVAEQRCCRAAALGLIADCRTEDDSSHDPATAASWGFARTVRPEILRWLCTWPAAWELIDPRGVQLFAARIDGQLDLSHVELAFPLGFFCCCLSGRLEITAAGTPALTITQTLIGSHGPLHEIDRHSPLDETLTPAPPRMKLPGRIKAAAGEAADSADEASDMFQPRWLRTFVTTFGAALRAQRN